MTKNRNLINNKDNKNFQFPNKMEVNKEIKNKRKQTLLIYLENSMNQNTNKRDHIRKIDHMIKDNKINIHKRIQLKIILESSFHQEYMAIATRNGDRDSDLNITNLKNITNNLSLKSLNQ